MTMDELIVALGIADEKKAEAGNVVKKFLDEAYVPKSQYDNVEEEKKTLQATISERDKQLVEVNVLPPIEAGASCFNENSATDSKELRRLTLSPQA